VRFNRGLSLVVLLLTSLVPSLVTAQQNVSPNLATSVPSQFYVDRYAPATFGLVNGFQGRNNVLQMSTDQNQDLLNRAPGFQSTFYNTVGMKKDVNTAGSWLFQSDIFVDASWSNSSNGLVRSDIWATATDDAGFANPSAYPIVGVTNYLGALRFRGYDVNTGNWLDFGNAVNLNSWNTLGMGFDLITNTFSYYVNGSLAASIVGGNTSTGVANIMYQMYNYNDGSLPGVPLNLGNPSQPGYSVNWSMTSTTVPEPSTYALLAAGLSVLFFAYRRRLHTMASVVQ
jgi:hypothetical protein